MCTHVYRYIIGQKNLVMEKGKTTFTKEKFQKIDFVKSVKTGDVVVLQINILNKEKMRHEYGQI